MLKFLFFFFFCFYAYSQRELRGSVSDSIAPLENANILAKPIGKGAIRFAVSDNKGKFVLDLEKEVNYTISVSYIGYAPQKIEISSENTLKEYHFKLKAIGEQLKEVVITHNYTPISVKQDTITYKISAFLSGNERKMKEILEKLPGVEVDKKGSVFVNGKKITQMLIEGKLFFGGGSKLAVENIPADALDKIEVIDNYNEVDFLKKVSISEDLAMNVKLKEDKKKFVFGDIEAGVGYRKSYLLHSSLFYYSSDLNISTIVDANNLGKSVFSLDDLIRFQGGISAFSSNNAKPNTNLLSFSLENKEFSEHKSNFLALNYGFSSVNKMNISGFGLFSNIFANEKQLTNIEYLTNSYLFENRSSDEDKKDILGIFNIKIDYNPNKDNKWYYNAQWNASNNHLKNTLLSVNNTENSTFKTFKEADNISLKQYIEWHKSYTDNHITTFMINHIYDKKSIDNQWINNKPFLLSFIPLENEDFYHLKQIKNLNNNKLDVLFKYYWIVSKFHHLYINLGSNLAFNSLKINEKQLLSNQKEKDLTLANFGNDLKYQLTDAFLGVDYRFMIEKLITKFSLYVHCYSLKTSQLSNVNAFNISILEPSLDSKYDFNKSEAINLKYSLKNNFPTENLLINNYSLDDYQTIFKGNSLLKNESFHSFTMSYTRWGRLRGVNMNTSFTFLKKEKGIRNTYIFEGTNRYIFPILLENPETSWNIRTNIEQKINKFKYKVYFNANWFNYKQLINSISSENTKTSQNIGVSFRTFFKENPNINIFYNKEFIQYKILTNSNLHSDSFSVGLDYSFWNSWSMNGNYQYARINYEKFTQKNFHMLNLSLDFQKKNNPFGYNLLINNLLDIQTQENNSLSDIQITERIKYILPRTFLFSVRYKL